MLLEDDNILFCEATKMGCQRIIHLFNMYAQASDHKINKDK